MKRTESIDMIEIEGDNQSGHRETAVTTRSMRLDEHGSVPNVILSDRDTVEACGWWYLTAIGAISTFRDGQEPLASVGSRRNK
jgi:hypothetical protein